MGVESASQVLAAGGASGPRGAWRAAQSALAAANSKLMASLSRWHTSTKKAERQSTFLLEAARSY